MVRYRLLELLEERGWTRYRFAQALVALGMTETTVYQLTRPERRGRFQRIEHDTLDRICTVLNVQPGELLEWIPEKRAKGR
ncbi:MAG: helix-turn-helix domain-containing protein [Gemmatimonadaceae bacterium]